MSLQLELWQLVTLAVSLMLASVSAFWAISKLLMTQQLKHQDMRFDAIEDQMQREAGQWSRLERDLLKLQADLPLHYVRREDYIRGQSVIEAKLDGLATKFENALLRGMLGSRHGD